MVLILTPNSTTRMDLSLFKKWYDISKFHFFVKCGVFNSKIYYIEQKVAASSEGSMER